MAFPGPLPPKGIPSSQAGSKAQAQSWVFRSLGLLFLLWHCRKCRGSSCRTGVGTESGHGCPSPLSHLAPPCHRAALTWLLSEPTRLPSTGANREVHIRFWGDRLSRVSPGRLKATGLACGGEGRGRLRHGDQAPICLVTDSTDSTSPSWGMGGKRYQGQREPTQAQETISWAYLKVPRFPNAS